MTLLESPLLAPGQHFRTRLATTADFEACLTIDADFQTNRVWQMSCRGHKQRLDIHFQTAHLPRLTRVTYPYTLNQRAEQWYEANYVAIAETDEQLCAYAALHIDPSKQTAWLRDLIVNPTQRRQGIGTALLSMAQQWAQQRELNELVTAVQTKNHPAIQFYHHHGFTFCGYHEYWFPSGDIALFLHLAI